MSRYNPARVAIRRPAPYDTAQKRCDTHGKRETLRAVGARVTIQYLYHDRDARHDVLTRVYAQQYDRSCAATRPGQACDTAQCVRRLGKGWVHCALDSVHYSESLFGHCSPGSIVHEVLKK